MSSLQLIVSLLVSSLWFPIGTKPCSNTILDIAVINSIFVVRNSFIVGHYRHYLNHFWYEHRSLVHPSNIYEIVKYQLLLFPWPRARGRLREGYKALPEESPPSIGQPALRKRGFREERQRSRNDTARG